MWFACQRVVANKGAAGADGIAAGEFKGHLTQHWLAIMAKLPEGKYNAHERPCSEANQASSNACLRLGQCPCPVLAPQSMIANRRITDIVYRMDLLTDPRAAIASNSYSDSMLASLTTFA